ncbi:MAG TPA: hypothetical protein VGU00_16880 [Sphingopyxis sp.]|jgi:hypothetical protein|nr:hypothetical protein [Sphingopyxis sp.]
MNAPAPIPQHPNLVAALEKLYDVFSAPPPPVIEGCPCCIDTRGVDVLLSTPLRELSGKVLWRYITGAYLTVGGDRDFRYLLPRIFDLSAFSPFEIPDTEIVLGKLARARWTTWETLEREAVWQFVDAWFDYALEQDLRDGAEGWLVGSRAESILCGAAYAGMPLSGWLARLLEPRAAPLLADLVERYPNGMSAFWEDAPGGLEQLSPILARGSA